MRCFDERRHGLPRSVCKSLKVIASRLTPYVVLFLVGCAIPQVPYRTVYEDPVNYVRLEVDDSVLPEWPPSAHTHPKAIGTEEVARLLGGISVQEHRIWLQKWLQGEAPLVPAFRPRSSPSCPCRSQRPSPWPGRTNA